MQRVFVSYHFNLVSVRVKVVTVGVRQKELTLIKDQGGLQRLDQYQLQYQLQHKHHRNQQQLSVNIRMSINIGLLASAFALLSAPRTVTSKYPHQPDSLYSSLSLKSYHRTGLV